MIEEVNFDGLLKISCSTMPTGLASWLFVDYFDSERSELVFLGRGRIAVTAEAVADILDLPNGGDQVKYELDVDAINFMQNKYDIVHGSAPKIEEIMERIKKNRSANENQVGSWKTLLQRLASMC